MIKKILFILFASLSLPAIQIQAQTPDWSSKIASIMYANCTVCHHAGAIAPFSLIEYENAFAYSFSIQSQVNAKKMPPWPADPNYSHFWDERVLSDADITSINDWVNGGMPSGDLSAAPPPPVYNGAATMLNPDDTIQLPVYTIQSNIDDYRTFVIHSNYTETKYINSYEFIPGDWAVVHHASFHYDTSDVSYEKDLADTLPGFASGGFGEPSPYSVSFAAWLPGNGIFRFPSNMGLEILPNSDFVISLHYSPGNLGKIDSSKLYLKFCTLPDSLIRKVNKSRWLFTQYPVLVNGPLEIPANTVKTFNEVSFPTSHKSLLGLNPHSHLICSSWQVRMVTSAGDTTNLLSIPHWNFNWQYGYFLTKVMEIPSGAIMLGEATFDNTTNNPDNPNNPPEDIYEGAQSYDEMMMCNFMTIDYQPGDEDIIMDSSFYGLPTSQVSIADKLALNIYPNPVSDVFHLISDLPAHDVNWELTNLFGVVVKSMKLNHVSKGVYVQDIDVTGLAGGIYQLSIQSGGVMAVKKLTVVR